MKFGPQELKVMRRYPTSLCYENRVLVETIECYDAQIAHLVKVTERQSEMLALALKEKNDAIEDRFRMSTQLDLRGKELSATRDNIPFRFIDGGVRTPDAVRALTGAWQSQNKELEKLRPPEPKFRVGQAVVRLKSGGGPITELCRQPIQKILSRDFRDGQWWYVVYGWGPFTEDAFRELTEEEK